MNDALTISTGTSGTCPVLYLHGILALTTVAVLRTALHEVTLKTGDWLVIDLGAVEFCDSAGMSGLIAAHNRALTARAGFALTAVPRHILVALRVVGLDRVFPLYPTVDAAFEAYQPIDTDGTEPDIA